MEKPAVGENFLRNLEFQPASVIQLIQDFSFEAVLDEEIAGLDREMALIQA
jgi:hypothetical protein